MPAGQVPKLTAGGDAAVALRGEVDVGEMFALQCDITHELSKGPARAARIDLSEVSAASLSSLKILCGVLRSARPAVPQASVVIVIASGVLARTIASWEIEGVQVAEAASAGLLKSQPTTDRAVEPSATQSSGRGV